MGLRASRDLHLRDARRGGASRDVLGKPGERLLGCGRLDGPPDPVAAEPAGRNRHSMPERAVEAPESSESGAALERSMLMLEQEMGHAPSLSQTSGPDIGDNAEKAP
jgi:hypothetical protein